jgi:hypothetical protein
MTIDGPGGLSDVDPVPRKAYASTIFQLLPGGSACLKKIVALLFALVVPKTFCFPAVSGEGEFENAIPGTERIIGFPGKLPSAL